MKSSKAIRWIIVTVVAALVASATTAVILVLRARAKKKAWYDEDADFGYDLEEDPEDWDVTEDAATEEDAAQEPVEE